jgi:hypothetical protein
VTGHPLSRRSDRRLRTELAALYRQAVEVVDFGQEWPWTPSKESVAANEPRLVTGLQAFLVAEIAEGNGLNLPLTQARSLLREAAGCFEVLAALTVMESPVARLASVGPVARSAAEKSSTARWVLAGESPFVDPSDRTGRLTRALIVEISGIEQLLRFFPEIAREDTQEFLQAARTKLLTLAEVECGPVEVTKKQSLRSIAGVSLPSLTQRVSLASGNQFYAEQSAGTHPTGHSAVLTSHSSWAGDGIVYYETRSTVHGESRLVEPAVMAFCAGLARVGQLIEPLEAWSVERWAIELADKWTEWCVANGCR